MHISELITNRPREDLEKSERAQIIKEIYKYYDTGQERLIRKKENWKRYISYLKENHTPDSKENQKLFRKSKKFIRQIEVRGMCFMLSHIKTKDLYHVQSIVKDRFNREQSIGSYIVSLIK